MDVQIGCVCPPVADGPARHERDTVTLRDKLDFRMASAIRNGIAVAKMEDPDLSSGEILAILTEGYILHGIESWSVTDDKGKALPASKPNIRALLLADALTAEAIGEAADALYSQAILAPLVQRALTSSQPSPTTAPTSARKGGTAKLPKPSKPSSTSISGTGGTATITSLRAGDSNSSPSSATAA